MEEETKDLLNFGEPVEDLEFLEELRYRLWNDLLQRPTNTIQFPGSQPGHRLPSTINGLVLISEIDRNFECRELPGLVLPGKIPGTKHEDTLLDGELICDIDEEGKKEFIFMIFDALLISGLNVMRMSLPERLKAALKAGKLTSYPFRIDIKKMWKPYGIAEILEHEIPKLRHENDGLIFTPVHDHYKAGTCEGLLKWKPSELNTVDFKLVIDRGEPEERQYQLFVGTRNGAHRFFAWHKPDPELDKLEGAIIECKFVKGKDGGTGDSWEFTRVRADKTMANNERIVLKIIDSIKDNVTAKQLIDRIPRIHRNFKEREQRSQSSVLDLFKDPKRSKTR